MRDNFHGNSDIDILIQFAPHTRQGLLTIAKIKYELKKKVSISVDIALQYSVKNSENWIRRNEILGTVQIIYEQR